MRGYSLREAEGEYKAYLFQLKWGVIIHWFFLLHLFCHLLDTVNRKGKTHTNIRSVTWNWPPKSSFWLIITFVLAHLPKETNICFLSSCNLGQTWSNFNIFLVWCFEFNCISLLRLVILTCRIMSRSDSSTIL